MPRRSASPKAERIFRPLIDHCRLAGVEHDGQDVMLAEQDAQLLSRDWVGFPLISWAN